MMKNLLGLVGVTATCSIHGVDGFFLHPRQPMVATTTKSLRTRKRRTTLLLPLRSATANNSEDDDSTIVDRSTLTLLEHINLDVPSFDYNEYTIPFYFEILGCGIDPRMAPNFLEKPPVIESTIWANCGSCQFHLCYSPETPPTTIQGGKIGLRFASTSGLKTRIQQHLKQVNDDSSSKCCFESYEEGTDSQGNPQITLIDRYQNVFVCRAIKKISSSSSSSIKAQPILSPSETSKLLLASKNKNTEHQEETAPQEEERSVVSCQNIDYLEIPCPRGMATKIANFYESVFDATTNVVAISTSQNIAMIGLGNIHSNGRADQYLLFKEEEEEDDDDDPTTTTNQQPQKQQQQRHHIAIYVGENQADFIQAYRNAEMAGIVWINPRFGDKVDSIKAAKQWNQFRFKDIVDLESVDGTTIMELEHEIRSLEHPSWPGRTK